MHSARRVAALIRRFFMRSFMVVMALGAWTALAQPVLAEEAGAGEWLIDMDHSAVTFSVRHIVGTVPGMFDRFSGDVELDPAAPEKGQFYLLIDSGSVHTGVPARDDHLRSPDFLDVGRAPRIIFASRRIVPRNPKQFDVIGDLTIKDVTQEITVPVQIVGIVQHPMKERMPTTTVMGLHAEFRINRLEFHVGDPAWTQMGTLGDTVSLTADMELLRRH